METHRKADKYTTTVAERLQQTYQCVTLAKTKKQKKAMKAKWNKTHIESPFRINDVVWYKIEKQKKGENRKLAPKYTGPYKITNIVDSEHRLVVDITYLNNLNDQHRVSVRQLKKVFLKPEQLVIKL